MKKIIMLAVILFSVVGICLAEENDYERLTQFKIDTTGAGGLYQLDFDNAWEYRESIRHADSVNKFWMTEHEAILLNQTRIFDHIDSSNKAQTKELANSIRKISYFEGNDTDSTKTTGDENSLFKDWILYVLPILITFIVAVYFFRESTKQNRELQDSIIHISEEARAGLKKILEKINLPSNIKIDVQEVIENLIKEVRISLVRSLSLKFGLTLNNVFKIAITLSLPLSISLSLMSMCDVDKKVSRLDGKLDRHLEEMRNRNPDNLNFYYPDTINLNQFNAYFYNSIDTTTRYVKICTLVISVPETIRVPKPFIITIYDTIIDTIFKNDTIKIEVVDTVEVPVIVYKDTCTEKTPLPPPSPTPVPGIDYIYCTGSGEKCLAVKEFIYPSERGGGVFQNYLIFYPCDKRTLFNVQIEYKFRDPFISIANNSKLDFGHYPERFVSTQNGDYLIYKIKELRGNEVIRFNITSYSALVVQDRKISCACEGR